MKKITKQQIEEIKKKKTLNDKIDKDGDTKIQK